VNARETYLQKLALAGKLITPVTEADLIAGPWSKFKDKHTGGVYKTPWDAIYIQTNHGPQAEQVFRATLGMDPFEHSCCVECGSDFEWEEGPTFTNWTPSTGKDTWFKSVLWIKADDFEGIFEAADAVILQDILETPTAHAGDIDLDADGNIKLDTIPASWVSLVLNKEMTAWQSSVLAAFAVPPEMLGLPSGYPLKTKYSLKGLDFETDPYIKAKKYIKGPDYSLKGVDDVDVDDNAFIGMDPKEKP
jgi:hypothetical protein